VPAKDDYTTRIRDLKANGNPGADLTDFWGFTVGGQELGSGHPADSWAQFGLHVEVVDQADDGSYGTIRIWNSLYETEVTADYGAEGGGSIPQEIDPGTTATATLSIRNVGNPMSNTVVIVQLPDNIDVIPGTVSPEWTPLGASSVAAAAAEIEANGLQASATATAEAQLFAYATDWWAAGVELPDLTFAYTAGDEGDATGSIHVFGSGGDVVIEKDLPSFEVAFEKQYLPLIMN
jgi:hypothetical protein